jgi:hypothetical protein
MVDQPVVEDLAGAFLLVEVGEDVADLRTERLVESLRDGDRLDGRGAERGDDTERLGQIRMVPHLDGEDLGIDGCGIDSTFCDHPDRHLVEPALDDLTEESVRGADRNEVVPGDAVARLGERLVVSP